MTTETQRTKPDENRSLLIRFANRFGIDEVKLLKTLKATVFRQRNGTVPSDEQLIALLIVAEQYVLNPFTQEIYAFPDKSGGIVPVVGVDGWTRIINSHPDYDGIEFVYSDNLVLMPQALTRGHEWIKCVIYRKSLNRPTRIREYLDEVYRPAKLSNGQIKPGPWQTHPKRFHRHKTLIQAARLAFGFAGIYDQDEAERIAEIDITPNGVVPSSRPPLSIGHERQLELDEFIANLIKRSAPANTWFAAHQWADGRLKGDEHRYVMDRLVQAEAEHKQSQESDSISAEAAHQGSEQEPELSSTEAIQPMTEAESGSPEQEAPPSENDSATPQPTKPIQFVKPDQPERQTSNADCHSAFDDAEAIGF